MTAQSTISIRAGAQDNALIFRIVQRIFQDSKGGGTHRTLSAHPGPSQGRGRFLLRTCPGRRAPGSTGCSARGLPENIRALEGGTTRKGSGNGAFLRTVIVRERHDIRAEVDDIWGDRVGQLLASESARKGWNTRGSTGKGSEMRCDV